MKMQNPMLHHKSVEVAVQSVIPNAHILNSNPKFKSREKSRGNHFGTHGNQFKKTAYNQPKKHVDTKRVDSCSFCGKQGHLEPRCWKAHPELAPDWIKEKVNKVQLGNQLITRSA